MNAMQPMSGLNGLNGFNPLNLERGTLNRVQLLNRRKALNGLNPSIGIRAGSWNDWNRGGGCGVRPSGTAGTIGTTGTGAVDVA